MDNLDYKEDIVDNFGMYSLANDNGYAANDEEESFLKDMVGHLSIIDGYLEQSLTNDVLMAKADTLQARENTLEGVNDNFGMYSKSRNNMAAEGVGLAALIGLIIAAWGPINDFLEGIYEIVTDIADGVVSIISAVTNWISSIYNGLNDAADAVAGWTTENLPGESAERATIRERDPILAQTNSGLGQSERRRRGGASGSGSTYRDTLDRARQATGTYTPIEAATRALGRAIGSSQSSESVEPSTSVSGNTRNINISNPRNIIELGHQLQNNGVRVSENNEFGGLTVNHQMAAHGTRGLDINITNAAEGNEADIPWAKASFDRLALRLQTQGFRVLWNNRIYDAGQSTSRSANIGHRNHMHIEEPRNGLIPRAGTREGTTLNAASAQRSISANISRMRRMISPQSNRAPISPPQNGRSIEAPRNSRASVNVNNYLERFGFPQEAVI